MKSDYQTQQLHSIRRGILIALTAITLFGCSQKAMGQWTNGTNINNTNSGNVGIGTTTPQGLFSVASGNSTWYLGPAPLAWSNKYSIFGPNVGSPTGAAVGLAYNTYDDSGILISVAPNTAWKPMAYQAGGHKFYVSGAAAGSESMIITNAGNVGIGTATPNSNYKLDVNGNTNVTGSINITGNINAKFQDVAEWVQSSEKLPTGTVVVLDSTKSNQVTASTVGYDTRVAGVISEQPGIALGEKGESKVLVATTGRVRMKVDATRAPIHIGDLLVTSDVPGVAMKSEPVNLGGVQIHRPGTLIGKALEPLEKGSGEILVLLSLQ